MWNCRGIKKKGVSSFLKNLISEHNFHFIGIQETMVENIDDITLKGFDPNSNYLWKWIPSRGKSGGLLSGINTKFLDVGGFCEGKYILQLDVWDKHLKQKWNFLNVYGAAQLEHKNEFLTELARFCCKNNQPHLIGGDLTLSGSPLTRINLQEYTNILISLTTSFPHMNCWTCIWLVVNIPGQITRRTLP